LDLFNATDCQMVAYKDPTSARANVVAQGRFRGVFTNRTAQQWRKVRSSTVEKTQQ